MMPLLQQNRLRASVFLFGLFGIFFLFHCSKKPNVIIDPNASGDCISDEKYFQTYVWNPVIKAKGCFGCHKENGVANDAQAAGTYNVNWGLTEDISTNLATLKTIAMNETMIPGKSALLFKPTLAKGPDAAVNKATEHHGGVIFAEGSTEFQILEEFYNRTKTPTTCVSNAKAADLPQGVVLSGYTETLQKAGLSLLGRVPTREEENLVYEKGFAGLKEALDNFMNEPAFYERLREVFNDILLTDKYMFWQVLNTTEYPNAEWYTKITLPNNTLNALRNVTRKSIARSPIELMIYTVRNNLSFQNILTAPYTLVNPFSARSYGVKPALAIKDYELKYNNDYYKDYVYFESKFYDKFEPVTLNSNNGAIPHAGVLTDKIFLLRYPTTGTNVNRHRAHTTLKLFLNFDILKELTLPEEDLTNIADVNPTLTYSACAGCHTILDPIAGTFKNWNDNAEYQPRDWYDKISNTSWNYWRKMRAPGMTESNLMPNSYYNNSLQWLGANVAKDPRFARSIAKHLFRFLTGAKDIDPGADGYEYQQQLIGQYSENFIKSNYNLKSLIKDIIAGPYFRAKNVLDLVAVDPKQIIDVGVGRMLTPEQLSRKIDSVLGLNWSENPWDPEYIPYLLNRYKLLYGGIDSDNTTVRVATPNAIMANIQMRMAVSMACRVTAKDFGILDKNRRRLFMHAEKEFIPFTPAQAATIPDSALDGDCAAASQTGTCTTGHEIYHGLNNNTAYSSIERADAVNQIKRNIQHLHKIILGEVLPIFDKEIHNTYKLWRATYTEMAKANNKTLDWQCVNHQLGDINIYNDNYYTIKAWQAVIAYLLSDFRFVFE